MCSANARDFDMAGDLFVRYQKRIRSYIRKRCDGSRVPVYHADDIANEVFLRVRQYGIPNDCKNIFAYLAQVAFHHVADLATRSRYSKEHISLDDDEDRDLAAPAIEPDYVLEQQQLSEQIEKALREQLRPRQRDLLLLHEGGMTYKELAKSRGISYRIVLRDLTRAYATLRHALAHEVEYIAVDPDQQVEANTEKPMPPEFPRMNTRFRTRTLQQKYRVTVAVLNKWRETIRVEVKKTPPQIGGNAVSNIVTIERAKAQKSIAIEKSIPIPKSNREKDLRFPWEQMEVGDAYWIGLADEPDITPGKEAMHQLHNRQAARCQKAGKDFKRQFKARIQRRDPQNPDSENGVRVWRTK